MVVIRCGFGKATHELPLVIGIFEAVEKHMIQHLLMTHAQTLACLGQDVRRIAHAFHTTGDHDPVAAGQDQIVGQHGGLHGRTADFVDGGAAGCIGQAGGQCCLASGALPQSGR